MNYKNGKVDRAMQDAYSPKYTNVSSNIRNSL